MKKLLVLAVALLVGVAAFNPGMSEFEAYVQGRLNPNMAITVGVESLSRSVDREMQDLIQADLAEVTTYRSYVIASVYDVDLNDSGTPEYRFVGVASQFIMIRSPGL